MKTDAVEACLFRPGVGDDTPFIFSSWLRSYREGSAHAAGIQKAVYFRMHHKLIERLLERSQVLVASNPERPDQIVGYLVCERVAGVLVLHYLYVKAFARKEGVASALLELAGATPAAGPQHTHHTEMGRRVVEKVKSVFNPYLSH